MSIGGIGPSFLPSFLSPNQAMPAEAEQMLRSIAAQGQNSPYLSSYAPGTPGLAAIGGVAASILSPTSWWGRAAANTAGQSLPNLYTPNVSSVLTNSSLASTAMNIFGGGNADGTLQSVASTMGANEAQVVANMGPGVRSLYNQLLKDDPKQARAFLLQEMMASLKLMGEMLSNVSKTRSEIALTFARNARA